MKGSIKGEVESFNNSLPGYPDNITYCNGIYWVALFSNSSKIIENLWKTELIRKIIWRLPKSFRHAKENKPYGFILGFNKKGEVVYNLQDPSGDSGFYNSAIEFNDQLFLGSNVSD